MQQRFDLLSDAGKQLARIPRFGRLLATMPREQLSCIQTKAATYLALYQYVDFRNDPNQTGLIDSGLNTSGAELLGWLGSDVDSQASREPKPNRENYETRQWQCKLAMNILGAIAFEMYCHNQRLGRPPTHPIDHDLATFKKSVCDRCTSAGAYVDELGQAILTLNLIRNDFQRVEKMNSQGLEYAILSSAGADHHFLGNDKRHLLFFADVSTQAFFAAYWAMVWSNDTSDIRAVANWVTDPIPEENDVFLEFWQMALELPNSVVDQQRFRNIFSVLFDRHLQPDPQRPIRSTELMYHAWDHMQGTAAIDKYQKEFAQLLADRNGTAVGLLHNEQGESAFVQLADPKKNARDRWDTGEFMMGAPDGEAPGWDGAGESQDNPQHRVKLSPYRLHRYCVTNAEYELFDPRHQAHREFTDQADVSAHPVVNVSWYDAWCFSRWAGELEITDGGASHRYMITLPSEAQWEYGCRCGLETPFTWSDRGNAQRIQSGDCNFDGRYPWPRAGRDSERSLVYLQRTIAVHGRDEALFVLPNPWGLHQMHGNVWEWCDDWYAGDYYRASRVFEDPRGPNSGRDRVLRGGCWIHEGEYCRSGFRYWYDPAFRCWLYGFRLAAVLKK